MQNSSVRYGADRTLVTGKARIVGVDVIRLDKSDKPHEQHAEQSESPEPCGAIVRLPDANQIELPHKILLILQLSTGRRAD